MSWRDRLRPAAYTAPDGTRLEFDYEATREELPRKTAAFDFPDADGTYVQDLGVSSRRYPLRCIFHGGNYDLAADAFMEVLGQRGPGTLEHPVYGPRLVVPTGTPTRRDDLIRAANQAIVEVEFWETTGLAYPTADIDPAGEVLSAVERFNRAAAEAYAEGIDRSDPLAGAQLRGALQAAASRTSAELRGAAQTTDAVLRQFEETERSIIAGLDDTIGRALNLASQVVLFVQEPARTTSGIRARLRAYRQLLNVVTGRTPEPSFGARAQNQFLTDNLTASSSVTGSVLSGVYNQFDTRGEALDAAERILAQFSDAVAWRDNGFQSLGLRDTGGGYSELLDAVAIGAGYLVQISFSLQQERAIVTDRPRALVELCAELYGSDDRLDSFIISNDFTGSEILEIPRGRRVVYYV